MMDALCCAVRGAARFTLRCVPAPTVPALNHRNSSGRVLKFERCIIGVLHRQGSVRIFEAGIKILTHRHQIYYDAQWRVSKNGPVHSWYCVEMLTPHYLSENPCTLVSFPA